MFSVLKVLLISANLFADLMFTVMEASNFTPSVYSVHALTLLAEVKRLHICCVSVGRQQAVLMLFLFLFITSQVALTHI